MTKHVPLRRCVACRRSRPQAELVRLHLGPNGRWQPDPARKQGGRGAWICRDEEQCRQPKRLKRFFGNQAEEVGAAVSALVVEG